MITPKHSIELQTNINIEYHVKVLLKMLKRFILNGYII